MAKTRSGSNLGQIADALDVSVATVSNALSGKGRVSAELVEKIRRKADEIGYVPSPAGRALRTGRTGVLGLVLPDIANPLFPQIAQAMEAAASKAGYGVLIGDSRGDVSTQTQAITRLIERGVDGLVVIPRRGTRIADVDRPVAVVDTPSTPGNTVSADHWDGGRKVTQYLGDLGHQKIVLIGYDPASNVQIDRIGGFKSGMKAGMRADTIWIKEIEADHGEGCPLGLVDMVAAGATAFAAVSDLHALRALTELQRAGINVPEQVSVAGFDDLIFSPVVTPALTSVHMNMDEIAEIAIAALISVIEAGTNPKTKSGTENGGRGDMIVSAETSRVPMELVVRQSCARPGKIDVTIQKGEAGK